MSTIAGNPSKKKIKSFSLLLAKAFIPFYIRIYEEINDDFSIQFHHTANLLMRIICGDGSFWSRGYIPRFSLPVSFSSFLLHIRRFYATIYPRKSQ